jgi:hypothetical protein
MEYDILVTAVEGRGFTNLSAADSSLTVVLQAALNHEVRRRTVWALMDRPQSWLIKLSLLFEAG